jgi:hypothetical protein
MKDFPESKKNLVKVRIRSFEKKVIEKFRQITLCLNRGVFRILILRVLRVNRIFPLQVLTAGAFSLFLNITGAIAPVAPVLNTPLLNIASLILCVIDGDLTRHMKDLRGPLVTIFQTVSRDMT